MMGIDYQHFQKYSYYHLNKGHGFFLIFMGTDAAWPLAQCPINVEFRDILYIKKVVSLSPQWIFSSCSRRQRLKTVCAIGRCGQGSGLALPAAEGSPSESTLIGTCAKTINFEKYIVARRISSLRDNAIIPLSPNLKQIQTKESITIILFVNIISNFSLLGATAGFLNTSSRF